MTVRVCVCVCECSQTDRQIDRAKKRGNTNKVRTTEEKRKGKRKEGKHALTHTPKSQGKNMEKGTEETERKKKTHKTAFATNRPPWRVGREVSFLCLCALVSLLLFSLSLLFLALLSLSLPPAYTYKSSFSLFFAFGLSKNIISCKGKERE